MTRWTASDQVKGAAPRHLRFWLEARMGQILMYRFNRPLIEIVEMRECCTAAQGFNAHAARSREEIEEVHTANIAADDVEKRLFDAVHDRTRRVAGHRLQLHAARCAGDDAQGHG